MYVHIHKNSTYFTKKNLLNFTNFIQSKYNHNLIRVPQKRMTLAAFGHAPAPPSCGQRKGPWEHLGERRPRRPETC